MGRRGGRLPGFLMVVGDEESDDKMVEVSYSYCLRVSYPTCLFFTWLPWTCNWQMYPFLCSIVVSLILCSLLVFHCRWCTRRWAPLLPQRAWATAAPSPPVSASATAPRSTISTTWR